MIFTIILSILGFFTSALIAVSKYRNTFHCLIRGNECRDVILSKYNRFLVIPNEIFGLGYYAFMFFSAMWSFTNVIVPLVAFAAMSFSFVFAGIQIGILRKICIYCFFTAGVNVFLFLNALLGKS